MAVKMKGILKGIKYISHIFVHKEDHEMEIGYPTDVKHVAHIGFDSSFGSSPSWMNDFKTGSDFSSGSFSNFGSRETSWASEDFDQQQKEFQPALAIFTDRPCPEIPRAPKKTKRKKSKGSPSSSARSSQSSVSRASYSTAIEDPGDIIRTNYRLA